MQSVAKVVSVLLLSASICLGQLPKSGTPEKAVSTQEEKPNGLEARNREKEPTEPKPYEKVITKEAKSKKGIFTVHQIKDKWFFEIPRSEMNKDFLWVSQLARVPEGAERGGRLSGRVIRWERYNNRILLREVKYNMVVDAQDPVAKAVEASNSSTILMALNVEAWGKDEAAVVDVTKLYATDGELGPNKGSLDASRSFIERISAFPSNIEAETTNTYGGKAPAPNPLAMLLGGPPPNLPGTYLVHYSMVKLPEQPMMGRLSDDRVGFFTDRQTDFDGNKQKVSERQFISRWRLEKQDPNAALSEPVRPIVYYVDPATPKKYVPYIKRAIEAWQVAFEEAGFKNAIVAKEAPTPEQDPEWSAEDVRNTIVRWLPSATENAMGPHLSDPRSGETLNGNVTIYQNILNLQRAWYFTQAAPLDPRGQKFPFPDELMGQLLEYVVKHEVGHTLGLRHNFKASSLYAQEKVRDREWVHKMGHCPSIMDYSRFNYVAQPEDNIDVADLIPQIGPYDKYAIRWGYKPIPTAKTPEEEKATLDAWSREQDTNPYLRFAADESKDGFDPGEQTEAVGDADAVKSTALGIKNLARVADMLLSATTTEKGEPYEDLALMYGRLLRQWNLEMGHVVRIVGGVYSDNKHIGQQGVLFTPVPVARQKAAVKFLNENAFVTPSFFIKPEILGRIEPVGAVSRMATAQIAVLKKLLDPARLTRMEELAAAYGNKTYAPLDFLADVRKGVWKELYGGGPVKVDVYRRNLQRAYVDHLGGQLIKVGGDDARAFFRGDLLALSAAVKAAIPRASDGTTRMHLEDIKDQIAKAMDPKFVPAPAGKSGLRIGFADPIQSSDRSTCWPD